MTIPIIPKNKRLIVSPLDVKKSTIVVPDKEPELKGDTVFRVEAVSEEITDISVGDFLLISPMIPCDRIKYKGDTYLSVQHSAVIGKITKHSDLIGS